MSRGERIRRYRKMKGLTQKSLAERIGLAESAVRNYELGLRDPSQETLAALSDALGVPLSALDDYELSSAREALEGDLRIARQRTLLGRSLMAAFVPPFSLP